MAVSQFEIARRGDAENAQLDFNASPAKEEYKRELASSLFQGVPDLNRVLAFTSKPLASPRRVSLSPASPNTPPSLRSLYSLNRDSPQTPKRPHRKIPQMAERILDAPDLIDDYYLNLLDWNLDDILVIALGSAVYLWNNADGSIVKLLHEPPESSFDVTSVAWSPCSKQLLVGTSQATVELWDTSTLKKIRSLEGHSARVGSLAWAGSNVCSSGSRNGELRHHDMRTPPHAVSVVKAHALEVCGLKWSSGASISNTTGGARLASGGNDNTLNIWDDRQLATPAFKITRHTAAVKVCAIQFSKHDRELVSSHGFTHNQLILWKYPSMVKLAELSGHTSRVLHMAQSPDGTTVASAGADETLRFWKVFSGTARKWDEEIDMREGVTGARTIR
ncbi:WD40-repeat-containing domain protein [Pavlovales sp. CCMP2436]|nr:WD40-repeat-containing domain protein [Pavlovales sp. CCMP2436]